MPTLALSTKSTPTPYNAPDVQYNAATAYDGTRLSSRIPFVPEPAHTATVGDRQLAQDTGIPQEVIAAFRSSVPYWRLVKDPDRVAVALGVDRQELRASLNRGLQEIYRARVFPAVASRAGYNAIRSDRR